MKHFTIIGGGVAGLTAAIGLQKIGMQATVYEGAPVLKGIGAGFGLAANAMKALEYLGLRTEVMALGHLLPDYNILDEKGQILVAPDTSSISQRYKQDNFAIHRADLHQYLLSKIEPSSLQLGYRAVQLQQHQEKIILTFDNGHTVETDYLLIADGVKSALRQQLIPSSAPRYSGYTCWRATIDNSTIQLGKGSETWGAKGRFGMTPLVGNKIYWYACINTKANNPVYRNWNIENLRQHFASYHHPIPEILNETENSQLIWNDIIDIKPLNQLAFGNILLMGDAGHATTPNMGQGACQAIEDVAVLIDELKKDKTIAQAFLDFEKRRLSRTRYITETSWTIGQVAQWQNPALIAMRNFLMKILPENLQQYKLNKLLNVDFMEINNKR